MANTVKERWLGQVADLYFKLEAEARADFEKEDDSLTEFAEAQYITEVLARFILDARGVQVVGDLAACETDDFRLEGLCYLVDRDAADHFDDVGGYIDALIMHGFYQSAAASGRFSELPAGANGLALCEWLDQHVAFEQPAETI